MKINRTLSVIALVLLVLSVWSYRSSVARADRFERGQKFLPNLNLDDVAEISLVKGDEKVTLKRDGDEFTVAEAEGYPATNESVNRVLRAALDMSLEKKVGRGDDLFEELDLTPEAEGSVEVSFANAAGQAMVHFLVGKHFEEGSGTYVRRLDDDDAPAYLTASRVSITTSPSTFLKKEIVDVNRDDIARIKGPDYVISDTEDGLKLQEVPAGREEKPAEMSRAKGMLSYLRFDEVFLADDDAVRDLRFAPLVEVELKDGSGYTLGLAEKEGSSYLQIQGMYSVDRVTVSRDETDEELKDKAEILSRADEMSKFNAFHGSWVYKINQATADKIKLGKSDLIQAKS